MGSEYGTPPHPASRINAPITSSRVRVTTTSRAAATRTRWRWGSSSRRAGHNTSGPRSCPETPTDCRTPSLRCSHRTPRAHQRAMRLEWVVPPLQQGPDGATVPGRSAPCLRSGPEPYCAGMDELMVWPAAGRYAHRSTWRQRAPAPDHRQLAHCTHTRDDGARARDQPQGATRPHVQPVSLTPSPLTVSAVKVLVLTKCPPPGIGSPGQAHGSGGIDGRCVRTTSSPIVLSPHLLSQSTRGKQVERSPRLRAHSDPPTIRTVVGLGNALAAAPDGGHRLGSPGVDIRMSASACCDA